MKKLLIMLLLLQYMAQAQPPVLSSGEWIKISVTQSGVYKIDKAFLDKNAPSFSRVNPDLIQIYTGYPSVLPQKNDIQVLKGLEQVPVFHNDKNNKWDKDDFIAFYAEGPHQIISQNGKYHQELNPYSNLNYYFITMGTSPSKKITSVNFKQESGVQDYLPYFQFEENEKVNLLQSGRLWLGDFLNKDLSLNLPTDDFVSDFQLNLELFPVGRLNQFLEISNGNTILLTDTLLGNPYNATDNLGRYNRISNPVSYQWKSSSPISTLTLKLSSESVGSPGAYIHYWAVNYNRKITPTENAQIIFRISSPLENKNLKITGSKPGISLWQVNSPFEVKTLEINSSDLFSVDSNVSEVILFDNKSLKTPAFQGKLPTQNLSMTLFPEMLVVFPEKFRESASQLIDYKRRNEGLEILGYSTSEIYNYYSSGKTDPSAIRNFCKDLYNQSTGKLKYLLLLGDASYDFKNNLQSRFIDPDLLIPTYQSRESLEPIYSYSSDDYFGFLKDGLGEWPEGYSNNNTWISSTDKDHLLDIAIGRIPAKNTGELNHYIEKYISYRKTIPLSNWQNKIAFVADNRDYNTHQRDAETLENIALKRYPGFLTDKLYLDDFPIEKTETGYISPLAKEKLNRLVNQGTYLIAYNGHGAENGLTDEKLLTLSDILNTQNAATLPIWLTATCTFGRFDNPGVVSAAELSLLKPDGGAIALLTTTRAVFSNTNQLVNTAFFQNLSHSKTLGELFQLTKNQSVQGEINRNFSLLGDPSLPLPNWNNNVGLQLDSDTLAALNQINFSGFTQNISNGKLLLTVIDKPDTQTTLGTFADGPAFTYQKRSNILFQGVYPVKNSNFAGNFKLPKQQQEGTGKGRIILSVADSTQELIDYGYLDEIIISSEPEDAEFEKQPPILNPSISQQESLIWEIEDKNGINISEKDFQTQLRLTVDDKLIPNPFDYYHPIESGQKARIIFPVGNLKSGSHQSSLFVSNIYNISTSESFSFQIIKPELKITETRIYPNPASEFLNIKLSHNRQGDDLTLKLLLFDLKGNLAGEETMICNNCTKTITFTPNLNVLNPTVTNLAYQLILKSDTDNGIDRNSGVLFFWK